MYRPTWREHVAYLVYVWVLRLAIPVYLARIFWRGWQEPGYAAQWWRRLGWFETAHRRHWQRFATPDAPVVWVHAVSLGEARAAQPLIMALRQRLPRMRLLLTHTTATGMLEGRKILREGDVQTWLPYDIPGAVNRFLRLHLPQVGVLMETEVWPVLLREAEHLAVPMVLANARLSDKSLRQGQRLAWLMHPAVHRMAAVLAQSQDDAQRVQLLKQPTHEPAQDGPDESILVCGNVKFDMAPPAAQIALGQKWHDMSLHAERPLVLLASSREGEEARLLAAWQRALDALTHNAKPRLLIVPRHPQRFDEVAELMRQHGFTCARKSAWPNNMPSADAMVADVWLGDSMGEMPVYYAAARVALLGGSFAPLGGQNLIEAAACGCPVIMGPSTFNFAQAAQWSQAAGSAWRVSGEDEAMEKAFQLCTLSPEAWLQLHQRCLSFAQHHQGASQRMAGEIARLKRLKP